MTLLACAYAQSTTVVLRPGAPQASGAVTDVSIDGVTLLSSGRSRSIGLDWVADVSGEHGAAFRDLKKTADLTWRARARLERGDLVSAEPLLEELFRTYRGREGPTAAMVAAGLLRVRLAKGATTAAVPAFLEWRRVVSKDDSLAAINPMDAESAVAIFSLDPATRLAPGLPPMWLETPSVHALAREQPEAEAVGAWYHAAARFECGLPVEMPAGEVTDPGIELVRLVVISRIGDDAQRSNAREQIRSRLLREPPAWQQAWLTAALGRSLLREQDEESRLLGVATLLGVAARFERACPWLTGVAMADASATLRTLGDVPGALRVKAELASIFPDHPALEWLAVKGLTGTPARAAPAASGDQVPAPEAGEGRP